jgi:hypothetical protein
MILGDSQIARRGAPERRGLFQNIYFFFNLCVSFFQKFAELLGQIPF